MALITAVDVPAELRPDTIAALLAALRRTEESSSRALVLRGSCSGVGLGCVAAWSEADNAALWELLSALRDSRLVTVAVVEGAASGGGVGLAAACDLVVAGPSAEFRLTELLVGLVPALIMPFLTARAGPNAVFHAAVLASRLDVDAAERLGLVDEVTPVPDRWLHRLALALRRMPRDAVADLKSCRRLLSAEPAGYPEHAYELLRAATADPAVRERLDALQGLRS